MKRFASIITIFAIASMLISACVVAPTPEVVEKVVTATPEPEGTEPVTLQFWYVEFGRDPAYIAMDNVITAFQEKYPHITVEQVRKPSSGFQDALTTAVLANEAPDVVMVQAGWAQQYIGQGALSPVTDIVQAIGEDQYGKGEEVSYALDGEWYAVPLMTFPHVVWYRTDLFEEKGLTIPETWDEMLEVAQALTEDTDGDGTIDLYGLVMAMQVSGIDSGYALQFGMNTNDAFILDAEGNPIVTGDNYDRMVESLEYIKALKSCCMADGVLTWSQTDTRNVFLAGEAAMLESSTSFFFNIQRDNPEFLANVSTFPLPYNTDNPDAESRNYWAGWGSSIMKTAKHPEEARLFLEFWHEYDNELKWFQETVTGWLPSRKELAEADSYWQSENLQPVAPVLRDAGSYATTHGEVLGMENGPNKWAGIFFGRLLYAQLWSKLIAEDMSPEDAANWLQSEMEAIISEG